jgi:hypothetical protein
MEEITFYAVSKWYKKEFTAAGWVLISGDADRIKDYLKHLNHLRDHLFDKFQSSRDYDKKNDLRIMLEKTEKLIGMVSSMVY